MSLEHQLEPRTPRVDVEVSLQVKYRLLLASIGIGSLLLLSGCGALNDPRIGKGPRNKAAASVETPIPMPTEGPPTLALNLDRNIWRVSPDEMITVCLGSGKVELLRVGGLREKGSLVRRVFDAGFGDSRHEDYSLLGFKEAFEEAACPEVAQQPSA